MDFFAGVVVGYGLSAAVVFWTFAFGTLTGVVLADVLSTRSDERCVDEDCARRVR